MRGGCGDGRSPDERWRGRRGGPSRYCPCCRSDLTWFRPFGLVRREEALCPACGSLERHRLLWLYINARTDLPDGRPKTMLHVAPEPQLARLFAATPGLEYVAADLAGRGAVVPMDVTDIRYPDDTFDVILCSHVLEHVPDDRRAMAELCRVLRPGGWAILLVPITADRTYEDPSVTDPAERERLFGQSDHVRRYGPDYVDRLEGAGFSVTVDAFARGMDEETRRRYGLIASEDIYLCRKGPNGPATRA